eukprot:TRINITY_DN1692_c0_g1_i2.p1 TRINITY_DN1692_c0_g1~~TRINITY_DN1692_c0_g1_i2.p1  ORF type:complete len:683 (+),score=119.42 TRINITY_DN1692_c0_g1_i2:183-2051(+)
MLVISDERFIYTVGGRPLPEKPYLPIVEVLDTVTGEWSSGANFTLINSDDANPNPHIVLFDGGLLVSQVDEQTQEATIQFINGTESYLYPPPPITSSSSSSSTCEGLMAVVDENTFIFFCQSTETYVFSSFTAWSEGSTSIFIPLGLLVGTPYKYAPTIQQINQLYRIDTVVFVMNGTQFISINPCAMLSRCSDGVQVFTNGSNICVTNQPPPSSSSSSSSSPSSSTTSFSYPCSPLTTELIAPFTMDPSFRTFNIVISNETFVLANNYDGLHDLALCGYDTFDGTQKWNFTMRGVYGSNQFLIDKVTDQIYVVLNATIYCYDLHSFALLWEEQPMPSSSSSPEAPIEIAWSTTIPSSPPSAPAAAVYLLYNGTAVMFNLQTRSLQWKIPTATGVDPYAISTFESIYATENIFYYQNYQYLSEGDAGVNITAIDIITGKQLWSYYKYSVGFEYTYLMADSDTVLVVGKSHLVGLSTTNASELWNSTLLKTSSSWLPVVMLTQKQQQPVAIAQNQLQSFNQLTAITTNNGSVLWVHPVYQLGIITSLSNNIVFSQIYYQDNGYTIGCDVMTGEIVWRYYQWDLFPYTDEQMITVSYLSEDNLELRSFNFYLSGTWWTPTELPF